MIKRLFLDIETCPCIGSFWRPGYKINLSHENIEVQARIITVAYKWQSDKKVSALIWDEGKGKQGPFGAFNQSDGRIIETIIPVMNEADEYCGTLRRWVRRSVAPDAGDVPRAHNTAVENGGYKVLGSEVFRPAVE